VAGLEEAIVPGVTGALCDPGDPEGLALAITEMLAVPAELDRMGLAARQRVRELFDFDRNFERMHSLLSGEDSRAVVQAAGA
jgi:glycosyltransferase involved in cell wall biosynthesis